MVAVLACDGGRQAEHITGLGAARDQLEANGRQMMALVDDQVPVVANQIVDITVPDKALDQCDVNTPRRFALAVSLPPLGRTTVTRSATEGGDPMAGTVHSNEPKARQWQQLASLPRKKMLDEIAVGLRLCLNSSNELATSADSLGEGHERARAILRLHAEEEAAKALMLIDLVRCPTSKQAERSRLANSMCLHLPRLIYAENCCWRPADFLELRRIVDDARVGSFRDGPNGHEYSFRNRMITEREELLYVDRTCSDGAFDWNAPTRASDLLMREGFYALERLRALTAVGDHCREGLDIIDNAWSEFYPDDTKRWLDHVAPVNKDIVYQFRVRGWLQSFRQGDIAKLLEWPMPMYHLDLSLARP